MIVNSFAKTIFLAALCLVVLSCQNNSNTTTVNSESGNVNKTNSNINLANNNQTQISEPQTVKFESADKVEIVGTFYESPKENSPAVLLLHQWMMNRKSYDDFAKRLQKGGIGVLAIDGRGFGDSTKTTDGKTFGLNPNAEKLGVPTVKNMKADVDNAFKFLAQQKNVDAARIGIIGASYGSSLAIICAAENKNAKAVALLSPGINYFENLPTENAVKNFGDKPLLMVASEDDKESADAVRKLKTDNEKSETKIYEQGGHGTDLFKVGLQDILEPFLKKSL